jgi:hypothetical protein
MAEWFKAAVLKTVDGETRPGVRIPLPPPNFGARPTRAAFVHAATGRSEKQEVTITNEDDALQSLRRAAREADTPAPVDRLSLVLNAVIPAVKKFADAFAEDSEMALFVGTAFCWFFGNHASIRATIPESQNASEMTCYKPSDFGPITVAHDSGKVSVRITGVPGTDSVELEAFGSDTNALEAVIPYLFGRGGAAAIRKT